jgi:hypothetical protein
MATKKVTRGEKPKRKIVISTIKMKKEHITKWDKLKEGYSPSSEQ